MTLGLDGLTLHPVQVFSYEAVKERAGTLGQPESAARIETMAWLLEIAAQMADELGARFVLHGGTTAQLHLKSAQQRGSADVDGLSPELLRRSKEPSRGSACGSPRSRRFSSSNGCR